MIDRWKTADAPTRWTVAIGVAFLVLAVAGGAQTGTSWDENAHRDYGAQILAFWGTLGGDRTAVTDWMRFYGGFYTSLASIAERLVPLPWPFVRHAVTAVLATVGLAYCVKLARLFADPWAGLAAAALLFTTPRFLGDAMFNPIDVPTAALYVAAIHYLAVLARSPADAPLSLWARFGIATGLTLAVRTAGLLPLAYSLALAAAWLAWKRQGAVPLARGIAVAWVCAFLAAAVFWPRLLVEPFVTIADAFGYTSKFPWTGAVLFRGRYHPGADIPWTYLPVWFSITIPLAVLGGLVSAAFLHREWLRPEDRLAAGLVLLAIVFPPAYATFVHATLYDGIRHFLFVLPPLAAIAGCGVVAAYREAAKSGTSYTRAVLAGTALLCAEPLVWYVRSHPYEYTYFNPLAGGLRKASRSYDTDYWGLSMRHAAEWLSDNRVAIVGSDGELKVITNTSWQLLEPWLDDPAKYRHVHTTVEPFHVYLETYRGQPSGWDRRGNPAYVFAPVGGQVPFFRTHLGPAAKR